MQVSITPASGRNPPVLITGGAGFIGCNLADYLLAEGARVRLFDNLARPGVADNLDWLKSRHGRRLRFIPGDVRDVRAVREAVAGCSFVYHLAAQEAMTSSLVQPLEHHAVNTGGTLNVLEAIRSQRRPPGLMFASTNKVYGCLTDLRLRRNEKRCIPRDEYLRLAGIGEDRPLQFVSPYGCSKGAADQYVLDYSLSYGLSAVALRMSCIYGPHQQASREQGWVVHFLRSALNDDSLTVFGDGKQVRDVLFIEDFVAALDLCRRRIEELKGRAFNIGGGAAHTVSLLELIELIERINGRAMNVRFDETRIGDQPYFVADHSRFTEATGWRPGTPVEEGIRRTRSWLLADRAPRPPVAAPRAEIRA